MCSKPPNYYGHCSWLPCPEHIEVSRALMGVLQTEQVGSSSNSLLSSGAYTPISIQRPLGIVNLVVTILSLVYVKNSNFCVHLFSFTNMTPRPCHSSGS
jgi:hypothetical protein